MFHTTNFKASDGWLTRFKVRHAIAFKRIHGEAAEVDQTALRDWQDHVLRPVIERYAPKDIYNLDETGLFFLSTSSSLDNEFQRYFSLLFLK